MDHGWEKICLNEYAFPKRFLEKHDFIVVEPENRASMIMNSQARAQSKKYTEKTGKIRPEEIIGFNQ